MVSFEEFSEAARESRKRTAISRAIAGTKEDIKLERALKKSFPKKKKKKKPSKILHKPSVKLPEYSATRVVSQLASEQEKLVREVPPKELIRDDRSLFFNSEFSKERKENNKWLS
jgi:hypothetical protein